MSNKTVIVADDTAFVRDRFATALVGAGHRALTVKSAAELLARIRADLAEIDLLVLDLRLPHAGGVELVRPIRKLDGGRLPILVFSGTIASAEEVASSRRWASPATSTNTAPCSTSCRRSRRTSSRTTSTGAAARAWCSASRSLIASATRSPRR